MASSLLDLHHHFYCMGCFQFEVHVDSMLKTSELQLTLFRQNRSNMHSEYGVVEIAGTRGSKRDCSHLLGSFA